MEAQKKAIVEDILKFNHVPYVMTDKHIDCQPCNNCGRYIVGVKLISRSDMRRFFGQNATIPKCEVCKKPCCPDCFRANEQVSYYCKDKCMEKATQLFVKHELDYKEWLKTYKTTTSYYNDTVNRRHTFTLTIERRQGMLLDSTQGIFQESTQN